MANAARVPDAWKRLREVRLAAFAGTRRGRLEAIARAVGVTLETETDVPAELDEWMSERVEQNAKSGDEALLALVQDRTYQVIVEPRALRVVTRLAADLFWRAWAAGP